MAGNFYAAEPLIVARLRDQLGNLVNTVDTVDLLAGNRDLADYLPAVFVMPSSSDPQSTAKRGGMIWDNQEYQVVIAVAHVHDPDTVAAVDLAAGGIMRAVFDALGGYHLDAGYGPMQYTGRAAPYYGVGFAEYPMFFSVNAVIGN